MKIQQTFTTQTRLSNGPEDGEGSHTVQVGGIDREFELDGQIEEYIPSRSQGDVRSLKEAAKLMSRPEVQRVVDSIRKTNSLGGKVKLGDGGTWDVYGHFGTYSVSRLDPKDGQRHRISFGGDRLSVYVETKVGDDLVKQEVSGRRNSAGKYQLHEELLTVESALDLMG